MRLEDPDSAETKEFVEKMKLTDVLKTKREKLRESSPNYMTFPSTLLHLGKDSLDGKPEVLLDPNTLSDDGTVALSAYAVSEDAKYLAYGTSSSGSDWVTIKVLRIADKITEPDTISWYVLLYIGENCDPVNKVYYCDLLSLPKGLEGYKGKKELLPFVKFVDKFEASYEYVANDDTIFTFLTNKDAPRNKLVRVDLKEPSSWTEVLQEDKKDVLESATAVNGNQIIVNYLRDVKNILQIRDLKTGSLLHHLPLEIGAVSEISSRRKDSIIFVGFTSFLIPGIIYTCNLQGEVPDMRIFREIVVPGFDRSEFESSQVFVPSKDGTKIPTFIVARKGLRLDGSHPCLLYGYGGFNISITPYFTASRILIAKHLDGVFCIANIRGGGEYGEEWHKAGALAKKQNCFDDFISAAEYLVSAGYTQPKKLCIEGGSNGGLLVGACINQRPDLFGCALAHVGVMDMLRFHKFTIGHAWTSDYGCSDKEEEFNWLIKYSPLHNVRRPWDKPSDKATQYPCTMLLTADHDDRVVPLHSLKLLATMQHVLCTSVEKSPQTNPIIGRIEQKAGHGAGMPTQKIIDEAADRYAFMAKVVDATWID
ncbi:UNVERIFIED_CONTAM: Prolyl endopeptidase [Sesamum radiatum]|uniref:Prolyl endopeptidase n=1 Tax=Sesamum radiatum TaxID=300843 RepID=A0AAW2PY72_SESRA